MLNEFKENIRSYATRALADVEQLSYIFYQLKFSQEPDQIKHLIESVDHYIDKIKDHMIAIEKLRAPENTNQEPSIETRVIEPTTNT